MNEINLTPFLPFLWLIKDIGLPLWIFIGSFILRKVAQILEKLFKSLEEFLASFTRISGVFFLVYIVVIVLKYLF